MLEKFKMSLLDGGMVRSISPSQINPEAGVFHTFKNIDNSYYGLLDKRPSVVWESTSPAPYFINRVYEHVEVSVHPTDPEHGEYLYTHHNIIACVNPRVDAPVAPFDETQFRIYRWDQTAEEWKNVGPDLMGNPVTHHAWRSGYRCAFLSFAGFLIFANGVNSLKFWPGVNHVDPNLEDAWYNPDGPRCLYLAEYKNRIVCTGIFRDRLKLHMSHTGDPTIWDPGAPGSNAFSTYIGVDSGSPLTGALNMGDQGLLIASESQLHLLYGATRADFTITMLHPHIGCVCQDTMVFIPPYGYFMDLSGVYRYRIGGAPERISEPIQEEFMALRSNHFHAWSNAFVYGDYYVLSFPTHGFNFREARENRLTWAYNTKRNSWSVWDVPPIDSVARLRQGEIRLSTPESLGTHRLGSDVVDVIHDNVGGSVRYPIVATLQTHELDMGTPEVEKDFADVYITVQHTKNPYELAVSFKTDTTKGWISRVPVLVEGDDGDRSVVRVPIQLTGRFLKLRLENKKEERFRPVELTVTFHRKGVL